MIKYGQQQQKFQLYDNKFCKNYEICILRNGFNEIIN